MWETKTDLSFLHLFSLDHTINRFPPLFMDDFISFSFFFLKNPIRYGKMIKGSNDLKGF